MLNTEIQLEELIVRVDAWNLPQESFSEVLRTEARLTCDTDLEPSSSFAADLPFASLRF